MKEEWNEVPVLCAYDVRGIQDYIFRTNRIVDVMGASKIIEDIIMDALKEAVKELEVKNALVDWEKEEFQFQNEIVPLQVLYVGGGNAYVLYRTGMLASKINRRMARYVLEESYSLQLAIASVEYTKNYSEDFRKLSRRLAEIKGQSPVSRVTGALPIMEVERATGFPAIEQSRKFGAKELIGYETKKKREAKEKEGEERILDNLITEKGVDSMIAIVHLDGNNMGNRILKLMKGIDSYSEAIQKIRQISKNINHSFKDTLKEMKNKIEEKSNQKVIRPLVAAGDDITFICNASIAMSAVEYFCKSISNKVLYQEKGEKEDLDTYGFSVCAGIAYVNSHFPFHAGYEIAEACCDNAKKRAKKYTVGERVGNWVDFQICRSLQAVDIKATRKKEYTLYDGSELCLRPYYIKVREKDALNTKCEAYDFQIFKDTYQYFSDTTKMPRSMAKEFRNTYPLGEYEMKALITFADSRGRKMPENRQKAFDKIEGKNTAIWYDALELMDYYVNLED